MSLKVDICLNFVKDGDSICMHTHIWWLILCITLTARREAQVAGTTLLLDMSVIVLLKDISIWIGRLIKEAWPPPMWEYCPIYWGDTRVKYEEGKFHFSLQSRTSHSSLALGHQTLDSWVFALRPGLTSSCWQVLKASDLDWFISLAFPSFPTCCWRSVGLPGSQVPYLRCLFLSLPPAAYMQWMDTFTVGFGTFGVQTWWRECSQEITSKTGS